MIRRSAVALLVLALAAPAHAGFDEILGGLEKKLGSTMWIPMFGLVRTIVRVGHPRGVHDLQFAMFEGKGAVDPLYMQSLMNREAGSDYTPLVRSRSRRGSAESTFVYARPLADKLELLVLTNDGDDTVLVRVVVDPAVASEYINHNPRSVSRVARR